MSPNEKIEWYGCKREATRVVVALAHGWQVLRVQVTGEGGRTSFSPPPPRTPDDGDPGAAAFTRLVILVAGQTADDDPRALARKVRTLRLAQLGLTEGDPAPAACSVSDEEVERELSAARLTVRRIELGNRKLVTNLARSLQQRKAHQLTGEEIEKLIGTPRLPW
jgi:hypothetical protein